jgi:hypothetical protein
VRDGGAVGLHGYACESWTDQAAVDAGMETRGVGEESEAWDELYRDGFQFLDVEALEG